MSIQVLALLLPLSFSQDAGATAPLEKRCQEILDAMREDAGFPGASFAAILPDGRTLAIASGFADTESETEMTPRDRMMAGSTGKTFFAALALWMAENDVLSLDDRVADYLGDEPWYSRLPNGEGITLRQLLDHTSGLPEYYVKKEFRDILATEPDRVWEPLDMVEIILDDRARFEPGEGWGYADTNYVVAGMVMEKATETKVYDQVQELFLDAHGLADTIPNDRPLLPGLIPGYRSPANPLGVPATKVTQRETYVVNPSFEWTGGGYVSTPSDLARWAKVLYEGEAFEGDYLEEMQKSHPARTGRDHRYGLGLQIIPLQVGKFIGHTGFFPGYLTAMGYLPEHGLALAIQLNTSDLQLARKPVVRYFNDLAPALISTK